MAYVDGFALAVPKQQIEAHKELARKCLRSDEILGIGRMCEFAAHPGSRADRWLTRPRPIAVICGRRRWFGLIRISADGNRRDPAWIL